MRLLWIVLVVCSLSSCAFIDGLHYQQNTSVKPDSQDKIQSSRATTPSANMNDQDNPSTDVAKTITPLVQ